MLAYDSYTKSVIGSVIEQRIRLFLNIRKIVNIPVFTSTVANTSTANDVADVFYKHFKNELGLGANGLYYDYAFSSILIDSPDYDFITNDRSTSLQKAEESLKNIFEDIINKKEFFSGTGDMQEPIDTSKSVLSFLKDTRYQREIPRFVKKLKLGDITDIFVKENNKNVGSLSDYWLKTDLLTPSKNEFTIQQMMDTNESPFYIDFFYRKKPSIKIGEQDREYRYSYQGEGDGYSNSQLPFQTGKDFAYRGARIMLNLTSALSINTSVVSSYGKIKYYPIKPSRYLPYYLNLINIINQDFNVQSNLRTYVDEYQLPFLSVYQNIGKNADVPANTLAAAKTFSGDTVQTFLSSAVFKLQTGLNPDNIVSDGSPHYFTGQYKTKYDVDKNVFLKMKKEHPKSKTDFDFLMWSKSLICFETSELNADEETTMGNLYCYFPMIIAEFIDETNELTDQEIIDKLLDSEQVKLFDNVIDKEKLFESLGTNNIVEENEKNIQKLLENYISPVELDLAGTTAKLYPEGNNPFQQIINASKSLDNTLLNLINLDGE
tara:strand:+ start:585 stop:2225 length:1641 start_codon:yes stop_codon:yes gene_type:complete